MRVSIPTAFLVTALVAACSSTHTKHSTKSSMSDGNMQAAMVEYSTPGAEHKKLEPLVGNFRCNVRIRMTPDAPWTESTGSADSRWIYGGRFVESNYRGTLEGKPFEGRSQTGYDNAEDVYVQSWSDNFATGLCPIAKGKMSGDGRTLTFRSEMTCPMTGQHVTMREVTTFEGSGKYRTESFKTMGDGEEFQTMEIEFTR